MIGFPPRESAAPRMKFHRRIVPHKIEQPPRAAHEARHDAVRVNRLEPVRNRPGRVEVLQAVGKHLRVDAEVALPAESREHRVRDHADADLKHGAVLHEVRNVLSDARVCLRDCVLRVLRERTIREDERRHALEPHMRCAMRARPSSRCLLQKRKSVPWILIQPRQGRIRIVRGSSFSFAPRLPARTHGQSPCSRT